MITLHYIIFRWLRGENITVPWLIVGASEWELKAALVNQMQAWAFNPDDCMKKTIDELLAMLNPEKIHWERDTKDIYVPEIGKLEQEIYHLRFVED